MRHMQVLWVPRKYNRSALGKGDLVFQNSPFTSARHLFTFTGSDSLTSKYSLLAVNLDGVYRSLNLYLYGNSLGQTSQRYADLTVLGFFGLWTEVANRPICDQSHVRDTKWTLI